MAPLASGYAYAKELERSWSCFADREEQFLAKLHSVHLYCRLKCLTIYSRNQGACAVMSYKQCEFVFNIHT